eukprot:2173291-Rhodomonas_salina.1
MMSLARARRMREDHVRGGRVTASRDQEADDAVRPCCGGREDRRASVLPRHPRPHITYTCCACHRRHAGDATTVRSGRTSMTGAALASMRSDRSVSRSSALSPPR